MFYLSHIVENFIIEANLGVSEIYNLFSSGWGHIIVYSRLIEMRWSILTVCTLHMCSHSIHNFIYKTCYYYKCKQPKAFYNLKRNEFLNKQNF